MAEATLIPVPLRTAPPPSLYPPLKLIFIHHVAGLQCEVGHTDRVCEGRPPSSGSHNSSLHGEYQRGTDRENLNVREGNLAYFYS